MPTRPCSTKKVKHKDYYCLASNKQPCVICEKPTEKTIVNKFNRVQYLELIDTNSLNWDAIFRFLNVMENRFTFQLKNGGVLNPYNVYTGKCITVKWDSMSASRIEEIEWIGEDFTGLVPSFVYELSDKAKFKKLKDKKRAILSYIEKANKQKYDRYTELVTHDMRVNCCSNVCLNIWLLRNNYA